ncbi:MAG TPA: glycosyltransferase [Steroidobacteraceae bacterium]|nr:glycosyltransferase [Steroidobacteraceae bacterium]
MPDTTPLVSVYMPTRNRAGLVTRAAASVLAQDRADLELLIVDDASADATPQVLARLAADDPRVRVLSMPRRGGAPAARNLALQAARGRFVTGIDDDDEMLPGRLGSLLEAFDPSYAFVCSGAWLHSGTWLRPSRTRAAVITLDEQLFGDQVGTQMLTLRERVVEAGGFDESLPAWQDYDLWTRLIERYGPALRIAEPSYVQRVEAGTERVTERGPEGARRFIEKHAVRMSPAQLASQQLELLMLERRRLRPAEAWRHLTPRTWRRALRYLLTSNFPGLRSMAERYRRWRWPLQLEARAGPDVGSTRDEGRS